jgi:hypothetical protein
MSDVERATLRKGDEVRRLKDGRTFKITFVNTKALNGPVFSADPTDGKWSHWGGGFPYPDEMGRRIPLRRRNRGNEMKRLKFLICIFKDHRFDGWEAAGAKPGQPLPVAYCGRCGREF